LFPTGFEVVDSTIGGTGEIVFAPSTSGNIVRASSGTLTIGAGITIRGATGTVGLGSTGLVNEGTILSDQAGQISILGSSWSNAATGTISADGGTISAQDSWSNAGRVSIDHQSSFFSTNGYTQTSTGTLSIELGGTATSLYATLEVTGTATVDGELEVTTEGFAPSAGDTFQAITSSNSVGGAFAIDPAGYTATYDNPGTGDVTIEAL